MRAILFASATVASLTGRRSRTPLSQTPAALFQCGARLIIDVAPRTSIVRISRLPALVIRPSRVLPPVEGCRGTRPSPAAPGSLVPCVSDNPGLRCLDAFSQCAAVVEQCPDGLQCSLRERRIGVDELHEFPELANALRNDQPELGRQATHGV